MMKMMKSSKKALATAIGTVLGVTALPASADSIYASYSGWFTLLSPDGASVLVNGDASTQAMYGRRTAITGTLSFDTITGAGTGVMNPFSFFGTGISGVSAMTFQAVGDGAGGAGALVLGNMSFLWKASPVPVSIVLDASGFFSAVGGGLATSDTVSGVGSLAATDGFVFDFGKYSYTLPMGPLPIATTTFNTSNIGTIAHDTNPSGTLPFTNDGIGGSPMQVGPFPGWNLNFDITSMHIFDPGYPAPVPAALWLFGSGLIGLLGVARRKSY